MRLYRWLLTEHERAALRFVDGPAAFWDLGHFPEGCGGKEGGGCGNPTGSVSGYLSKPFTRSGGGDIDKRTELPPLGEGQL